MFVASFISPATLPSFPYLPLREPHTDCFAVYSFAYEYHLQRIGFLGCGSDNRERLP
jgi:hypothetical protein